MPLPFPGLLSGFGAGGSSAGARGRALTYTIFDYGAGGVPAVTTIDPGSAFLTLSQGSVVILGPVPALITPTGAAASHVLSYLLPDVSLVPDGAYDALWQWSIGSVPKSKTAFGVLLSSATDTLWPTVADVQSYLASAGVTPRGDSDAQTLRIQRAIDAVTGDIGKLTLREFVAGTSDATRYYDGSGTPEQRVDDMVSLTSISLVAPNLSVVYTYPRAQLRREDLEPNNPKNNILILPETIPTASSFPVYDAFSRGLTYSEYRLVFPAGRGNIAVTGVFGFGATIPPDVWSAVAGEAAYRIAREATLVPAGAGTGGRVKAKTIGPAKVEFDWDVKLIEGWHADYLALVSPYGFYRKTRLRRPFRNLQSNMV